MVPTQAFDLVATLKLLRNLRLQDMDLMRTTWMPMSYLMLYNMLRITKLLQLLMPML